MYPLREEKIFRTSLSVCSPRVVLDLNDLCSLIENTALRESKQGWRLENYPKKTTEAAWAHVLLTLLTFTLAHAFASRLGQALAHCGIQRQRAEQRAGKVVLIDGDSFAIFDMEEVFIPWLITPTRCLLVDPAQVR